MKTPNAAPVELDCLELETVSSGKQPPPVVEGEAPKTGFLASVVAWKRKVGMPVLIPGL